MTASAALIRAIRDNIVLLPPSVSDLADDAVTAWAANPQGSLAAGVRRHVSEHAAQGLAAPAAEIAQDLAGFVADLADGKHPMSGYPTTNRIVLAMRHQGTPINDDYPNAIDDLGGSEHFERVASRVQVSLGAPASAAPWVAGEIDERRLLRLASVAEAGQRWNDRRIDERQRVPADASALLATYGMHLLGGLHAKTLVSGDATVAFPDYDTPVIARNRGLAAAISNAEPFFVGRGFATALYESRGLTDEDVTEIRLPYREVFVAFGDVIGIGDPDPGIGSEQMAAAEAILPVSLGQVTPAAMPLGAYPAAPCLAIAANSAYVEGLLLRSDADGRLCDEIGWCISIPDHTFSYSMARVVIPALRSACPMAEVVNNVAALVSWGDWEAPVKCDLPDDVTGGEFRKATRKGSFRRAEPSGAAGGVRVLDVQQTAMRADTSTSTGRSVSPHARRGHWRRVRVGSRHDWAIHRSRRRVWVPPTWVNDHLGAPAGARVYRIEPSDGDGIERSA